MEIIVKLGVYVHIPFCAAKCNYCDFNSHISTDSERERYVKALCREIEECKHSGAIVDTIYFGGGTPTVLKPAQLAEVLAVLRRRFVIDDNCEITTECNPATIVVSGFAELKMAGFNRVSIGMQSADDGLLKMLGRIHSFEQCRECVSAARGAGFENVSLDLMFGIPDQCIKAWEDTLRAAIDLKPEHLSCYALKVEEGTPFANMKLNIADEDASADMYDRCVEFLAQNGYMRYEVSNFAREGCESRHNKKYWLCDDFIGFGAGAYSCVENERFYNTAATDAYIDNVNQMGSAVQTRIPLSKEDKMSEFVYLGLRMDSGIGVKEFYKRFSVDIFEVFGDIIEKNIKRGTMIKEGDMLRIYPDFIYVSNAILADFVL